MKIIYQGKGGRSQIYERQKNAIQQIMSSGCGRGSDRVQAKRKRDLAHLAKIQGQDHPSQMTPEFGAKPRSSKKLYRPQSHEDSYPFRPEHSISDHSQLDEIPLSHTRNSNRKWHVSDSTSPKSFSRQSQPSTKSRNMPRKKTSHATFDPAFTGTPTQSPTTRDHTDPAEPSSSLIGVHSPGRSPRSQLSVRPFSAHEDIRSHDNSPRFLRKKSETSLLYDEDLKQIPIKRKKYWKPDYDHSSFHTLQTETKQPKEGNKGGQTHLLQACASSQNISLVCQEDIQDQYHQQTESFQEPTSEISLAEFQLPSQSHPPSQSLPLTISNVTFHNFFSEWENANQPQQLSVQYNYLCRPELKSIQLSHRSTLVNWLLCLSNTVPFSRETVHHSITIIDLFLSHCQIQIKLNELQLVGVAALSLAVKLGQIQCPSMQQLSQATCNFYTPNQIIKMEGIMAKALQFRLASLPVLARSMNQVMTEWDAFASLNASEYPLLSALIAPCQPLFGIMPSEQRRFLEVQEQQNILSCALFLKAYSTADSILFSLDSYGYTNTALCMSVIYFAFQDLYGFSSPLSKETEQELNDMFGCFVQTVLNVPFSHLAPTLEFVSQRMHIPLFKEAKDSERTLSSTSQFLSKEGRCEKNRVQLQSLFNLYDQILQEHRILETMFGYEVNSVDNELVMRSDNNLQVLEKEWKQWKGVSEKEGKGPPLAVKWESIYVAQSFYEDLKGLMGGSACP